MSDQFHIVDFLNPIDRSVLSEDLGYHDGQIGYHIDCFEESSFPDLEKADLILIGCAEQRGENVRFPESDAPDAVRRAFYDLYYWHEDMNIADLGNIRIGAGLQDSYAAVKTVLEELIQLGKPILILGGSHDLTLAQYRAMAAAGRSFTAACIDAQIDLNMDAVEPSRQFLMEMLTAEPNYIKHYNHIGFQSYDVHPRMLETMDKLRFDCFRLGHVKQDIEEMEPVLRQAQLLSFDVSAIANAYAPANIRFPNGFTGEEACTLLRYAGMSGLPLTLGLYGYDFKEDRHQLTARQLAQMIWYFLDGCSRGRREYALDDKNGFNEYHLAFADMETKFLQSKRTGRWWMQLPDEQYIACSHRDYIQASQNEIPERWFRAQERG